MIGSRNGAWTEVKSRTTLQSLRKRYPRYTDNELYAIWCRDHGLIPLDANEKLNLEQWRIHASEDGQHVADGGFRVSRAIYGRALKAQSGVAKPRQVRRKKSEIEAANTAASYVSNGLSDRAMELAKNYDRAVAVMTQALTKRQEALELASQLRGIDPYIAFDLAARHPEARELLEKVGALEPAASARSAELPAE